MKNLSGCIVFRPSSEIDTSRIQSMDANHSVDCGLRFLNINLLPREYLFYLVEHKYMLQMSLCAHEKERAY
jgi:hypothetical protein